MRSFAGMSAADRVPRPGGLDEPRRIDLVPFFLGRDRIANCRGDLGIGSTAAENRLQVGLFQAEQAVPQFAVGGNAKTIALHAEWPAHRGDEADTPNAV